MEGTAKGIWQPAYDIHAHEPLEKNGVLDRVFAALQAEGIINIDVDVVCLDSTTVKVHPDTCGALKKE